MLRQLANGGVNAVLRDDEALAEGKEPKLRERLPRYGVGGMGKKLKG